MPLAVSGAVSGDAGVAAEPNGITGQTLSWPGGLRLPASGQRPVWYWDPAAPQLSRTFDGVIAASATQIAWAPPGGSQSRGHHGDGPERARFRTCRGIEIAAGSHRGSARSRGGLLPWR